VEDERRGDRLAQPPVDVAQEAGVCIGPDQVGRDVIAQAQRIGTGFDLRDGIAQRHVHQTLKNRIDLAGILDRVLEKRRETEGVIGKAPRSVDLATTPARSPDSRRRIAIASITDRTGARTRKSSGMWISSGLPHSRQGLSQLGA
jgi:hypothetical protein